MAKITKDYVTLYQQYDPDPPGQPLATHVDPFHISNEIPTEAEVEAAIRCLNPNKEGGHTYLCA